MADHVESPLLVDVSSPPDPPDVMNDPKYETNTAGGEDGVGDPDTCRICRGEGSDTEALFHPCKCSGSIKHVHQDCLMEWLSHSQKKHCELCKTPFRFTKLYSPNMPQSLPTGVFFRHFVLHSMRNLGTWLRFCLVIMVWLGFLPYVIRQVWRMLFWFSDGGGPAQILAMGSMRNSTAIQASAKQALKVARELQLANLSANGTSPVTPFEATQTTSASVGGMMEKLVGFLMPFSQTLNVSGTDPLAVGLFKSLYYGFLPQSVVIPEGPNDVATVSQLIKSIYPSARNPSLLSDVGFLNNLTRHPSINALIVSIAEGYIITILVVVSFILVFLIREWVVQQQPGINMGAGFNAEFLIERVRDQPAPAGDAREPIPPLVEPREVGQRPIARPRRRNNNQPEDANPADLRRGRGDLPFDDGRTNQPSLVPDALPPAADIQRQLTEEPRMTEEFLSIWRRADSDPQEVLRIIERENKADQMRYWVNAMKILQTPSPRNAVEGDSGPSAPRDGSSQPSADDFNGRTLNPLFGQDSAAKSPAGSDRGSASGESWIDVPKPLGVNGTNISSGHTSPLELYSAAQLTQGKGKGKAKEEPEAPLLFAPATPIFSGIESRGFMNESEYAPNNTPEASLPSIFKSNVSRPRAISDGPKIRQGISPLGHGNWNFGKLGENSNPDHEITKEDASTVDAEREVFSGESAATFKIKFDFPSNPDEYQDWKVAQELRVQEAIAKGKEAHKSGKTFFLPSAIESSPEKGPVRRESNGPLEISGQDATARIGGDALTLEELFDSNPPSLDSEGGLEGMHDTLEPHAFAPDTPLPQVREPVAARPAEPRGVLGTIADWLWGGEDHQDEGANDEHIVEDLAAEAPFVPVAHRDAIDQDNEFPGQDQEVLDAAIAAGIDPNDADAIDDAEDFEGVMELVGMRGPVFSLVQNAIFSAFLLALTIGFGIWIPYNIGRVSFLLIANPGPAFKLPLRLVFYLAALLQDMVVSILGSALYVVIFIGSLPFKFGQGIRFGMRENLMASTSFEDTSLRLSYEAFGRIIDGTINVLLDFTDSDIFAFSAASHEALLQIKWLVTDTLEGIGRNIVFLFVGDYSVTIAGIGAASLAGVQYGWSLVNALPGFLAKPDSWVISLEVGKRAAPLDLELRIWDGMDRFWATFAGYSALSFLGALYVKKGSPFSTGQIGREWEATIIDLLNQAGGVMKVILIISIEMLVFPLYCGLLLDVALLPLFDKATIMSRFLFTVKSPLTSIFVHWFVGTCYMFHFALFVSMCRKIMRKGVLYFIRDPDDPTFHPVRDVLERNVATQLQKILFSALVYGALVVICLGGVVWGLSFAFNGVLPIHWSSNDPVLEFPIDLLFYNFLMPLAVRFFKPSDGLHAMYKWWFQQCARMLRLTWFMFDERQPDEEGHIVRRSWADLFRGIKSESLTIVRADDPNDLLKDPELSAYIRQDGRYVRAPASDQVRIPKGTKIFLEVDEFNNRSDGTWDRPDGVHGRDSELYKQVYIPPYFRLRICAFIVSIWLFAALTGVCITVVPLVFGRKVFANIIPTDVRKNDVYAFSIGIYILGSALYLALHARHLFTYISTSLSLTHETPANVYRHLKTVSLRITRVAWFYSACIFLLPTLFALLFEFYAFLPLHTYCFPSEPHTIHFVQSWTLGLLYVKLFTRLIQLYPDSRPAASLRQITRDGYLNPDARLATRSFILPATLLLSTALIWPWVVARVALSTVFRDMSEEDTTLVYRYVYPAVLTAAGLMYLLYLLVLGVRTWRMRIRDEVYLIGERLHNFGDKKAGGNVNEGVKPGIRRIET